MSNNSEDSSAVWSQYVNAKHNAFGEESEKDPAQTLEELEAAIAQLAASSGLSETGLPPRAIVHPVERSQLSRWFYLTLVLLFTALVVGMIWWGVQQQY
ncbi:MAG: hypothetical protein P0Y55_06330 [Candidatus Cohnella colombiensis]|uniref:Uncharacterized protein n=1 Tax=Candidatus Cohnella colombiensis TaxID=3121368 RepID=A0AA95JH47_9BACL|nr:MAG: hypothetical protein P0Y55_06330 [Cohnella sp.]